MSYRLTVTYTCDRCGRLWEHELLKVGPEEVISTPHCPPFPADWTKSLGEIENWISPQQDYCSTCRK